MSDSTTIENDPSPFVALESSLQMLCAGSRPLAIDGASIGDGVPQRLVPLTELRELLLHRSCLHETRNRAVATVVSHAQQQGGVWLVAAAGLMLPGLARASASLVRVCPHRRRDIQAEMLTGLLAAVTRLDPDGHGLASRLVWAGRHAAEYLVRVERSERARPGVEAVSAEPPRPVGHPDVVLARAVAAGVVSADDADVVGATRLGEMSLAEAADMRGVSYHLARKRRYRAEQLLVAWLREGAPEDFVPSSPAEAVCGGAGRPRHGQPRNRRPDVRSESVNSCTRR